LEYQKEGKSLRDSVIEAGKVRAKAIILTALTIIFASIVMIPDPVFGGLAIALIFGVISSTILTLFVIPLMYFIWQTYYPSPPELTDMAKIEKELLSKA